LPNCEYLFLAGDICKIGHINYTKFLQYCSDNWTKTFVVLGNHEYYNSRKTYDVLLSKYRELFELFDNVFLLEKDILELDDWVIVGCTLWSHIVNKQLGVVNCTHQIKKYMVPNKNNRKVPIGIDTYNQWGIESKEWLIKTINNPRYKNIIILTHYPITHKNIVSISGHTHFSHDFIHNNIRYIYPIKWVIKKN